MLNAHTIFTIFYSQAVLRAPCPSPKKRHSAFIKVGDEVTKDEPLTTNPNVGGFGQVKYGVFCTMSLVWGACCWQTWGGVENLEQQKFLLEVERKTCCFFFLENEWESVFGSSIDVFVDVCFVLFVCVWLDHLRS